jgi:hypothetical protein
MRRVGKTMFNFDPPHIICGLIFSSVGFVYFSYGRKMSVFELVMTGLALMTYPLFVESIPWNIGIGVVLSLLPFFFKWWN